MKARRIVQQSILERWADELVGMRRDVIEGAGVDIDRLRVLTSEIRLIAGGYPLAEPFDQT